MSPREHPTRLMAYLDGELDSAQVKAVEEHLTDCGQCRSELEALDGLMLRFEILDPVETADLWSGIENRLSAGVAPTPGWASRLAPLAYGSATAVALATGGYLGNAALAPQDAELTPDLLAISSLVAASDDALSRNYLDELLWEEATTDQEDRQ